MSAELAGLSQREVGKRRTRECGVCRWGNEIFGPRTKHGFFIMIMGK